MALFSFLMMSRLGILVFILLIQSSCHKPDIIVSNNNNNIITVIGHGGMGISHNYPMNTYPSLRRALNLGANGVEIDVQMTSDGVLVAYHDYDLSDRSTASGQIFMQTWEDISGSTYLNPLYSDYSILRLDSLFAGIPERREVVFILDCKNYNPDTSFIYLDTFVDALLNVLDTFQLEENVIIEFKRTDFIRNLRTKRERLKIFYYGDSFEQALKIAQEYNLDGITLSVHLLSVEQVSIAHSMDLMVSVVNTHTRSRNRRAIELNADIIQTDMLQYLIRLLKNSPHAEL
jgi:glycerophosphoryl diester phosphodiesterase